MITYSIIQKSQLEGALRLDAEYYQPEYLELDEILNKLGFMTLGQISSIITDGDHGNPEYSEKEGIPYIKSENMTEFTIELVDSKMISNEYSKKVRRACFSEEGDILLTTVGRIGTSTVNYVSNKIILSRDIARIHLKNDTEFLPEFITIFLNSRIGQLLTKRESVGTVQQGLYLNIIKNLKIPKSKKAFQKEIRNLFLESLKEYLQSKSLYFQADNLLLEKLGLKDFGIEDDLSYIVNLSDIKSSHRADAEYFQPKYDKLISKIKKQNSKLLEKVIENVPAKFNPSAQPEKVFQYVELANINSSIGVIDGFSEVLGKEAPSRAKRVLKIGDVIVSSVEGSLEKVALVDKEQENYLASTGFFQLRGKEILPEVLLVLTKSLVFQTQLEKQCAGTILTAVPKEAIKNIFVPILPKSTQQKIADLVQKSHQARLRAKELLEEAKRKVEELIEPRSTG